MVSRENGYYKALFDSYTETILQSGLLLDEDLEVLVNSKSGEINEFPKYRPTLLLKSSLSGLIGASILSGKYSKWLLVPPVFLASLSALLEIRNIRVNREQKHRLEDIVKILKKINSLYSSIKSYLKTRIEVETKSQTSLYRSFDKCIEKFSGECCLNETKYFDNVMEKLEFFVKHSENLEDDYQFIKDFKPFHQSELPIFDSIESCVSFIQKIQDIHVLLNSKLLSYMGITLNSAFFEDIIEIFLNKILCSILISSTQHYDITKKSFQSLKTSLTKIHECKTRSLKPELPNKLQKTVLSAIDNISIIHEKSCLILREINNAEECTSAIETSLVDLRSHTYAAYESLDLLCRLYGIMYSRNLKPDNEKLPSTCNQKIDDDIVKIRHDDNVAVEEENFELYLDKDYVPDEEPQKYVDDSGEYLSLMLKELRQSLKKHEKFIEAKRRRGSVDEEEVRKKVDVPVFNLETLEFKDNESVPSPPPSAGFNLPPPLPPPLPLASLSRESKTFNIENMQNYKNKSLVEGIKALSSQLNMEEEVFGESKSSDEDE